MAKEQRIKAAFMFEMLGKPPEHIKKSLSEFVDKLEDIKTIKIEKKIIHEPKPVEDENVKDLFTAFAEVEISAQNFSALSLVVFNAMPSHVEIIEPRNLNLSNAELSNILSDLTVTLHKYDEVAKRISYERSIIIKKLAEAENTIKNLGGDSILKKPNLENKEEK